MTADTGWTPDQPIVAFIEGDGIGIDIIIGLPGRFQ